MKTIHTQLLQPNFFSEALTASEIELEKNSLFKISQK